ncbi:hypothetical protein H5410_016737 [Solanum commersonii]|uniref:Uncharacterized protein n=1 Tax=Solanum commersonii TaxID=4109 RepID=A0A9J5ZXB4_SOLCO|nr:hypothetical protein H5410_016737 [Solanum commersonii]
MDKVYLACLFSAATQACAQSRGINGPITLGRHMVERYGMDDQWITKEVKNPYRVGIMEIYQKSVAQNLGNNRGWNLTFIRLLNDWEVDRLTEFYFVGPTSHIFFDFVAGSRAKNFSINEDTLLGMKDNKGKFIVKSAYKYFDNSVPISESWLWKIIRKVKIPHKVAYLHQIKGYQVVYAKKYIRSSSMLE